MIFHVRRMILSSVMKTISLTQLLSSCMDASRQGCEIIRDFHDQSLGGHGMSGTLKEGGEIKSVVTQADIDAQARIVGGLRQMWGESLRIIGEEEENDESDTSNLESVKLDSSLFTKVLNDGLIDEDIPIDDIVIFVDPLDGTREFVEGRLHNVACLIGVARNNRPIAGVIGLPFPDGRRDVPVRVHYAITDQAGSGGSWPSRSTSKDQSALSTNKVTILTGDSKDPVLLNATACAISLAEDPSHEVVGGTAAKLQIVATQANSIAILHFKTELWDTCSPQALIESNGGKVTDLFGSPLVHSPDRPFGNVFGVVASSGDPEATKIHDELCKRMREDVKAVHKIFGKWMRSSVPASPQAIDLARDLDGIPLSAEELERQILGNDAGRIATLKSYVAPEEGAWRGMMSSGCRLQFAWEEDTVATSHLPRSAFYKRIVMADLIHARNKSRVAPHKLLRDVKSYQVEMAFLTGKACELLKKETGIRINSVYGCDLRPVKVGRGPKEQLQSSFSVLLEDFSAEDGWSQKWLLNEKETKAALRTFAKMHAYFWHGSDFWRKEGGTLGEELMESVWENGGYMQPALQGHEQLENIAKGWEKRFPIFKDALDKAPEFNDADVLSDLGVRLERIASVVGEKAHPFGRTGTSFEAYRTLIHGDPKQANIFFQSIGEDDLQVGLIDFQWSGFGLAATDIAHHLSAAVLPCCVSMDGEKEIQLLDYYYDYLSEGLVEYGAAKTIDEVKTIIFPRNVLQKQYEIALLDICRMVFAYAWDRWKEETEPTMESFNRNAYNKSLDSALWLISRCQSLLQAYDTGVVDNHT